MVRHRVYRGRRTFERVMLALAAALAVLSLLCLTAVIPGVRFSGALAAVLAGVCLLAAALRRWSWRSQPGRVVWRVFCGVLAAGAVLFGTVEGLLLFRGQQDNRALPSDAVIVLGAGVNGTEPSLILQSRIDAAADYLERHPDVLAVLSGGRGPGEEITEAKAMAQGLTQRGIPASRLILEEASTSTAENFARSRELLERRGVDTETATITVVTSDFHCFRAHLIAQRAGLKVLDIPAESGWPLLDANYYVREFFALGKTLVLD